MARDLIQEAWDASEKLAIVAGVEYRVVGVVYMRESADGPPQPFSSQPDWKNTIPGQIATMGRELAELRKTIDDRDLALMEKDDEIEKLRAALAAVQSVAPTEVASSLALAAAEQAAEQVTPVDTLELAPADESPERFAAESVLPVGDQPFVPTEAEQAALAAASQPAAPPPDTEQPTEPLTELANVVFDTQGINGLPRHLKSIAVVELTRLPLTTFTFGEVEMKPEELQDMITRMIGGATKTAVLRTMPGFQNRKWTMYSSAYDAVANRIKPKASQAIKEVSQAMPARA